LPFLITLVPVFMGKFSLIMVLAYLFTVTGPIYFLLFQMAIYNKQTLPLNEKLTGKNQMENKWQIIVSMTTMFAPVIIISLLQLVFSANVAYWILFLSGLAITLTEPYWLRSIYRRMMLRRYENLEGFHASR
jgi:membrane-anchored protein YejM (alkaline phosphatase superfamily)